MYKEKKVYYSFICVFVFFVRTKKKKKNMKSLYHVMY